MNVTHTATIAQRLLSSDCLVPLRTMLLGVGGALLTLLGLHLYSRRASERMERIRRLRYGGAAVAVLVACAYLRAFSQSCDRQAVCGVEWDLNCSPINRAVYSAGQGVGLVIAVLLIAAEVRRRRRNPA